MSVWMYSRLVAFVRSPKFDPLSIVFIGAL